MDKEYARRLFMNAWEYCEKHHCGGLKWAFGVNKDTFNNITYSDFMANYRRLVTNESLDRKGSIMIANEGFETYKKRLKKEGINTLYELPGIDPTKKSFLAKSIGLADTKKPHEWLEYAAYKCKAASVEELIDYYLSKKCYLTKGSGSRHVIDFVLWRYGEKALFMDDVVMDKKYASRLFENAWEYCDCNELEWAKNANENIFKFVKSEDFSKFFVHADNYYRLLPYTWLLPYTLQRAAHKCKAASVDELVDYLSKKSDYSHRVVDFVLRRYENDKELYMLENKKEERAEELFRNAWEYCAKHHFEQLEWIRNTNEDIYKFIKSPDFYENLRWIRKFNLKRVIWLEYAAHKCKAASVDELVDYLSSKKPDCSPHVVDFVLWRYGEDKALYMYEDEDEEKDARELFEHAWEYCAEFHSDELEWAMSVNKDTFKNMGSKEFLRNYCWLVYTGNSRVKRFEVYFPELEAAFKDFDIIALSKMRSIKPVLNFFDEYSFTHPGAANLGDAGHQHEQKTKCFLAGAKMVANEGFETYKKRLQEEVKLNQLLRRMGKEEKTDPLGKLLDMNGDRSDIAQTTKSILESNLGLITDTIESDEDCFYDVSRHVVDFILRRYSLDG